ncbi:unnamed protein product [Protopolystoma xenopodis]|uniref:Uncharacterized protein n=1 Tax=Protopolystoma xenopodis TaxID=117903 RepID=A0A3S5ASL3_9PLAT|nr:unnamed protein product [Protopolystoma xenopodis]
MVGEGTRRQATDARPVFSSSAWRDSSLTHWPDSVRVPESAGSGARHTERATSSRPVWLRHASVSGNFHLGPFEARQWREANPQTSSHFTSGH